MTIINGVKNKTLMPGVTPIPDVVDSPTIGTASVANGQAYTGSANVSVPFTPAATGGTAASYTVTSSSGNTASGASSPISISDTVGTARTYTVRGVNTTATGPVSAASNSVTPISVPQNPTIGTATNATGQAYTGSAVISVPFTPGATGGSAITGYTVTSSSGATGTGSSSPISVTETVGNPTSTARTYTVRATNASGTSVASAASNSVAASSVPQAPTIGTATAGNTTASVAFTAGATGGSAITGYTATSSPGGITGTAASSPITVSGLTNNTAYTFTVRATNANGTSAASAASNSVTPKLTFGGTNFLNVVNNGSELTWTGAPAADASQNYAVVASKAGETTALKTTKNTITWQRKLNGGNTTPLTNGILSASDGSIYVAQNASNVGFVVKYNSSGTLQWQKTLTDVVIYDAVIGSDDNIYINGSRGIDGGVAIKIDSTGTLQWARKWGNTYMFTQGCSVDSSNNFYAASQYGIIKFNSSGTEQWRRGIQPGQYGRVMDVSTDSSGNVYAVGYTTLGDPGAEYSEYYMYKFNSSGTAQWYVTGVGANSISVASDGTIYVNGYGWAKFNTSGTLQLTRSTGVFSAYEVGLVGTDVLLGGWTPSGGNYYPTYARIPNDGSKTGTYTVNGINFVYASNSLSVTSTTIPSSISLTSASTTSVTVANSSLTDSAGTAALFSSE